MQTSQIITELAKALVGFHKEVSKVSKDSTNPFFKSKYASLSTILETINAPLINNGLSIVQFPEGEISLVTRIIHVSGEWMEATYQMKSTKETPQDRGSAITYQRRYAIGAILSLNIDEDDDGNKASQNGTTSYNHKAIEKPGMPIITNAQLKKALERISAGEIDIYYKVIAEFSVDTKQAELLKSTYETAKSVNKSPANGNK